MLPIERENWSSLLGRKDSNLLLATTAPHESQDFSYLLLPLSDPSSSSLSSSAYEREYELPASHETENSKSATDERTYLGPGLPREATYPSNSLAYSRKTGSQLLRLWNLPRLVELLSPSPSTWHSSFSRSVTDSKSPSSFSRLEIEVTRRWELLW